jgi:hypothetical protein
LKATSFPSRRPARCDIRIYAKDLSTDSTRSVFGPKDETAHLLTNFVNFDSLIISLIVLIFATLQLVCIAGYLDNTSCLFS